MPIAEYSYFIATPVVIIKHLRPWLDFLVVEKVVMDRHIVSRQLPGHACEECRRKKLRCDRQRPQCGACASSGRVCKVSNKRVRGVSNRHSIDTAAHGHDGPRQRRNVENNSRSSSTRENLLQSVQTHDSERERPESTPTCFVTQKAPDTSSSPTQSPTSVLTLPVSTPVSPESTQPSETGVPLSDVVKLDLVQLFLDRVHPNIPILNRTKLRNRTGDGNGTGRCRECLFDAIYTFAAAFSSQFSDIETALYTRCRSGLERWELLGSDSEICDIEYIQSWIFITFYEFSRINYRRGWLSAGRVFRLVQLAKLSDLDRPASLMSRGDGNETDLEEMRRTFWAAYCLDRLINLNGDDSVAFSEHMIYTRLPSSDADLANGVAIPETFLLEAMSSADLRPHSQLAECVILLNICGRIMSVERLNPFDMLFSTMASDIYARYDWLDSTMLRRLSHLQANHSSSMMALDPMTSFLYMIAHSATVVLCNSIEALPRSEQNQTLVWQFQQRGLWAAQEIVRLAREQQDTALFTAHTFMPLQIYLGAVRLTKQLKAQGRDTDAKMTESIETSLRTAYGSLRKLTSVNRLADHYLRLLGPLQLTQ
ncbi:fungal-specific transcription factor domain-containing protein [Ustulina deusta]|nr:fungal-specific transcription factor domain-containing protein [Ustulina deusta]